jgi:glycosyltransferase involved in cell wall biosynthesis
MDLWSLPWIAALLLRRRHRFVHACEESAFLAALLKPVFGFRLIYDMDDVLSLRLRRSGFLKSRRHVRLVAALERWLLRRCDAVVTNSRETTRYARARVPAERLAFYHHAPSLPPAAPDAAGDRRRLLDRWGLDGKKVILYAGNLEPYQGVDLLVESLPEVFSAMPGACCVVIGGQTGRIDSLKRRCGSLGMESSVRWLGPRPFDETYEFMRAADVLVSPMTQKKAVPMKLYAYVGSGTPIVATDLPNHRELLDEDSAVLVRPESGALARGILKVLEGDAAPERRAREGSAEEAAREGLRRAYAAAAV